jgi:hypothetical protein
MHVCSVLCDQRLKQRKKTKQQENLFNHDVLKCSIHYISSKNTYFWEAG